MLNREKITKFAIPVFEKEEDYYNLGNAYLLLGLIYSDISEQDNAATNIELAKKNYSRVPFPLNRVYFFQALIEPDKSKSMSLYRESVKAGAHEPAMTVQALSNLTMLCIKNNDLKNARTYMNQAWDLVNKDMGGNEVFQLILSNPEASLQLAEGDYAGVLKTVTHAETLASHFPGEAMEPEQYLLKSKALEAMGRTREAFEALKQYQLMNEESVRATEAKELPKAREREAIAHQKELVATVREQEKTARARLYVILLAVGVMLLMALIVLLIQRQRIRVRKMENRELRKSLEQEMVITRLNRENFEKDMQQKECEISSNVLLLSNKNEVLQQIAEITKDYSDNGRIPREYVSKINETVGNSLKNDDEWSRFKLHFDSVHPSFFTNLKAKSDELTENDLRLCAYIRIGMRSKEIAEMLAVSPASIHTSRYRIRKKLSLAKDSSLDDFIRRV